MRSTASPIPIPIPIPIPSLKKSIADTNGDTALIKYCQYQY